MRSDLKSSQIRRIFITHMHGDHTFGLPGFLASTGLAGSKGQIDIYGPPELKDYLKACTRYSHTHFASRVQVHGVQPGVVLENEQFTVTCNPLKHRIPAFGYAVTEKDRPGRFNVEKAKTLGIPPGPIYGRLKQGESINLPNGRRVSGKDLCDPDEPGRKFVYCTDTVFTENAVELAQNADVLIHEATFAHQDSDLAFERLHSTSTMAAQVALEAQVQQLIMTHFSPRYAPGNPLQLNHLLAEAQAIFPNTCLAYDFMEYAIPRQRQLETIRS